MTYLQFHLVFLLPLLVLLAVPVTRALRQRPWLGAGLATLVVIAYVWTTPWDNYLVASEVWGYGDGRVLGTIWYVPVEEYLFFGLQTLLTGGWTILLMQRAELLAPPPPTERASRVTVLAWGVGILASAALVVPEPTRYLGLILAWIGPPLALQWWFGGRWLADRLRQLWPAWVVPTVYLWFADGFAIANGIWSISERFTTGIALGPLPLEEALFFLVTNLVVVQGMLLFASVRTKVLEWVR
ncbi:lycopene cyclase domain-containing protein [Egicoccus halophilus]|uniref:Lycopene cyclase n=1 Tax=Egicoccus halophilus TaxID=1670830 RepID=A0A8J3A8K0_9ACTN|nr:lycopene cyclase domain-containing protein [Egicoccus halophilus]GGI04471.1 lycopene cyclase [Egicoccus halophilus]